MVTGADSLELKLARVPDAPAPVFPYSANVTWSVLGDRVYACVCARTRERNQSENTLKRMVEYAAHCGALRRRRCDQRSVRDVRGGKKKVS